MGTTAVSAQHGSATCRLGDFVREITRVVDATVAKSWMMSSHVLREGSHIALRDPRGLGVEMRVTPSDYQRHAAQGRRCNKRLRRFGENKDEFILTADTRWVNGRHL